MKTSEAFWMFLSSGLEKLFEMVKLERTEESHDIWLNFIQNVPLYSNYTTF